MKQVFCKLRKYNKKDYRLYLFCNFCAMLLITSYVVMMFSPTVMTVLPEGGDSRKQTYGIFALVSIGCIMFTVYASALFYRMKTREMGIMLALGAKRKKLQRYLFKEVTVLNGIASILGIVFGIPFTYGLWTLFRVFFVDTEEMVLSFNFTYLLISVVFAVVILSCSYLSAIPFLYRMNVMDVVNTEHKNEKVLPVHRWYGWVGILMVSVGGFLALRLPSLYMDMMQAYPPVWLNISYAPVIIGIYLILSHSVLNGWGSGTKKRYKNMVARGMMRFQGKQTVNSMLVITVLLGGACFASFYVPTMIVSSDASTDTRQFDYVYHYRGDVPMFDEGEFKQLATEYGVEVIKYGETDAEIFGFDGEREVEEGRKFHFEYDKLLQEARVISESGFNKLTGENIDVQPGTYRGLTDKEEIATLFLNEDATLLTNMCTGSELKVKWGGYAHCGELAGDNPFYVLNDEDFNSLREGNQKEWQEELVMVNVRNDQYEFANAFYNKFVACFPEEVIMNSGYDRVASVSAKQRGETYWMDKPEFYQEFHSLSAAQKDNAEFKRTWLYMPRSKVLDSSDFVKTYAVFLMIFIFVMLVCLISGLIIAYTRSITIALNNRYVFDDLKRLGASGAYLKKEIKRQIQIIFTIPSIVGMSAMYLLFIFILTMNSGYPQLTSAEVKGLFYCFLVLLGIVAVVYLVYKNTVRKMCKILL